jgi:hypothetical protein
MEIKKEKSWGWRTEILKKMSVSRFILRSTEVGNKCLDCENLMARQAPALWDGQGPGCRDLPFITFDLLQHRQEELPRSIAHIFFY